MTKKKGGPGKSHREGISVVGLADMFPDEATAARWFEAHVWPRGRHCPRCGSVETKKAPGEMPYWCPACRRHFSVRIGTALERSKVPLRKWAFAIYLEMTSLKGVSSMKLHRDIQVTQKTAWFMLHRIREAFGQERQALFAGPVEADETYFGGREGNKHADKKQRLGRGGIGKAAIAGAKDRATNEVRAGVVRATDAKTLQGFVAEHTAPGATVYTDEAAAHTGMPFKHEAVRHSAGEYVKEMAHIQRDRKLLGYAEGSAQGRLSQDQPEAPESLRPPVRGQTQRPPSRYDQPNAGRGCRDGGEALIVSGFGG